MFLKFTFGPPSLHLMNNKNVYALWFSQSYLLQNMVIEMLAGTLSQLQDSGLMLLNPRTSSYTLTFRHRASSILGQAFRYSPENAFYIFNQQIYFII